MNAVRKLFMMGLLCVSVCQLQTAASFNFSPEEQARLRLVNEIRGAMDSGDWGQAKELIEKHDLPQYSRDIFLRMAVQDKRLDSVKLLVDKGARILEKDHKGKSAMDYAQESGDQGIINYLRSKIVAPAA
ncbi:MAG: hypothetical protein WD055_02305 [Candidatus Dependentiae bacterium]